MSDVFQSGGYSEGETRERRHWRDSIPAGLHVVPEARVLNHYTTSLGTLTYDLDEQHGLVLSGGVGDDDGVVSLIFSLRPLNDEAAQVLPGLHPHTSLSLCDLLREPEMTVTNQKATSRAFDTKVNNNNQFCY